jgi:NAD(P)H-flavin reductase
MSAAQALPTALVPVPLRVAEVIRETAETTTLVLERPADCPIAPGLPGQFNMLTAFGIGEAAISLSGLGGDTGRLVHTVRAVGAVSAALAALVPGEWLGVRGPFGVGWPMPAARGRDVVLVAGGIGLAPLRPVIEAVLAERAAFGRLTVLYGARTARDRLFLPELAAWQASAALELGVTLDHADGDWAGHVGFVTGLVAQAAFDPATAIAMTCGPEVMMRAVAQALLLRGLPATEVYLSLERNMKCAVGLCGHCQFGPHFICKDGPVFPYARVRGLLTVREI